LVSPEAEQALASASAVVHLAGNLKPARGDYAAANVATSERVAASISPATCRRVVFLSFLGADPGAANAYLASKGAAEAILRATGVPTTILRCSHIVGPPEQPGPTARSLIASAGRLWPWPTWWTRSWLPWNRLAMARLISRDRRCTGCMS
jgi:uncharacterized protein YbjT (DUF2867 family)